MILFLLLLSIAACREVTHTITTSTVLTDVVEGDSTIDKISPIKIVGFKCQGGKRKYVESKSSVTCLECRGAVHELTYPPSIFTIGERISLRTSNVLPLDTETVRVVFNGSERVYKGLKRGEAFYLSEDIIAEGPFVTITSLKRTILINNTLFGRVLHFITRFSNLSKFSASDTYRLKNESVNSADVMKGFTVDGKHSYAYYDDLGEIYSRGERNGIKYFLLRYPLRPGEEIEFTLRTYGTYRYVGDFMESVNFPFTRCFCRSAEVVVGSFFGNSATVRFNDTMLSDIQVDLIPLRSRSILLTLCLMYAGFVIYKRWREGRRTKGRAEGEGVAERSS